MLLLRPLFFLLLVLLVLLPAHAGAPQPRTGGPSAGRELRIVNLLFPDSRREALAGGLQDLLRPLAADLVIVHAIQSTSPAGPPACSLAKALQMHCDFVSADPPSHPARHGTALLSARPLLADGITLLHGQDDESPVAAGFVRLDIDGEAVDVYVASLAPGPGHRSSRQHQARDLRSWMATQEDGIKLVAADFGSPSHELPGLMPGLRASRAPTAASASERPHGLDVLYPAPLELLETRLLQLVEPSSGDPLAVGLLVRLQLPAPAAANRGQAQSRRKGA